MQSLPIAVQIASSASQTPSPGAQSPPIAAQSPSPGAQRPPIAAQIVSTAPQTPSTAMQSLFMAAPNVPSTTQELYFAAQIASATTLNPWSVGTELSPPPHSEASAFVATPTSCEPTETPVVGYASTPRWEHEGLASIQKALVPETPQRSQLYKIPTMQTRKRNPYPSKSPRC